MKHHELKTWPEPFQAVVITQGGTFGLPPDVVVMTIRLGG